MDTSTALTILQHPRERFHPLGTVRLAALGLSRARVEVVWPGAPASSPAPIAGEGAAVLYPSASARPLEEVPRDEHPSHLIVLDGTWHHARKLHQALPWLHALPHYRLTPAAPSRYRLRREPARDYLSTIEAIVAALAILEPSNLAPRLLLDGFEAMIDRQIEARRLHAKVPRALERRPLSERRLPRAITDHYARLVLVYGESCPVPPSSRLSLDATGGARGPSTAASRELVQWVALRVSSGEVFEALLPPAQGRVEPWHLRHMRLESVRAEQQVTHPELARAWRRFSRSDDLLAAYSPGTLRLLPLVTGAAEARGPSALPDGPSALPYGPGTAPGGLDAAPNGPTTAPGGLDTLPSRAAPRVAPAAGAPGAGPLEAADPSTPPGLVLKAAYRSLQRCGHGALEDILRHEGLSGHPVACAGRASERLGNALALLALLRALAQGQGQGTASSVAPLGRSHSR